MIKHQYLLSICIPTYNRAKYLKEALDNITSDPSFDERVEIVVSDNASTDGTYAVVEMYSSKHSNIKYFRNNENIKDYNFYLALSRGTGKYLRLFNDTLRFTNKSLESMLYNISISDESVSLFFYQDIKVLGRIKVCKKGCGIDSFLNQVSYFTTWIVNFGCWKTDLEHIVSPNRFSSLQLSQVDWVFQIVSRKDYYTVIFDNHFNSIVPMKKGGYNIFNVFIKNYLQILNQYNFKVKTKIIEKDRLLRLFVMQWLWILYADKEKFTFDTKGKWEVIFHHFYLYPSLYLGLLKFFIKKGLQRCKL